MQIDSIKLFIGIEINYLDQKREMIREILKIKLKRAYGVYRNNLVKECRKFGIKEWEVDNFLKNCDKEFRIINLITGNKIILDRFFLHKEDME